MGRLAFRAVWCCDFEFSQPDGEVPTVRCVVAKEYHTGRTVRLWLDDGPVPPRPPFDTGPDSVFVAFFATAEVGCFLSLGWPTPVNVIDLYVEFKRLTCGRDGVPGKPSLVFALDYFGLPSMAVEAKQEMRDLAIRGGPYTADERRALLDYAEADVDSLIRLLPRLLPDLDVPRAVLRGGFMKSAARVERAGVPMDVPVLAQLEEHWEDLQFGMIEVIDRDYGVYEGTSFRVERFARWLARRGLAWPRLESGELELTDEAFKDLATAHPELQPLHQLRQAMATLRFADLPVGRDGRNRCLLSPFGTITGRCAPSTSKFVFARPAWMRSLVRPEEGRALAYLDWSSQEYGVGAVLSGDPAMVADYAAGDPYLGFAKRIGMVPPGATKAAHRSERNTVKALVLGVQYGMGERSLAVRINKPVAYARDLLRAHRATYPRFWAWSDAVVNQALFHGRLWTRFGWHVQPRYKRPTHRDAGDPNIRSLQNFPCQANAAEMLRLATGFILDRGVQVDALVHDAVLIEAASEDIDDAVERAEDAMGRASELVLSGFRLRTDAHAIRWPDHYRDDRGVRFFDGLMGRLAERARRPDRWASGPLTRVDGAGRATSGGSPPPPAAPPPI
jgi:hypothetical protein